MLKLLIQKKGITSRSMMTGLIIMLLILLVSGIFFSVIAKSGEQFNDFTKCGNAGIKGYCLPKCGDNLESFSTNSDFGCEEMEDDIKTTADDEMPEVLNRVISEEEWKTRYHDESTWKTCCYELGE